MTQRTDRTTDERSLELPVVHAATSLDSTHDIDIVKLVLQNKWLLILGGIMGLALGHGAYLWRGPEYQAQAQILVSKPAPVLDRQSEFGTNGAGERGEHVALIMSPMIVGHAVDKYELGQLASMANSTDIVQDIVDDLKVKRSAGQDRSSLNVLDLTYINRNRIAARTVVTAVIGAYDNYLRQSQKEHTGEIVRLITQANIDLSQQLRDKQNEYLAFRDSTPLHWKNPPGSETMAGDVTNVHQQSLETIHKELDVNILEVTKAKSRIDSLQQLIDSGESRESLKALVRMFLSTSGNQSITPVLTTRAEPDGLAAQWLPLLLEEQRLLKDFGEDHPDVQQVRNGLRTIREFYRQRGVILTDSDNETAIGSKPNPESVDVLTVYMSSLKAQLNESELRQTELERMAIKEDKLAKQFAHYQAMDQTYNDEIRTIKDLSTVVVSRLKELELVQNNRGYAMKQIAPVRDELVFKRQLKFCGGGLILALGLVLGFAHLKELTDNTLKSLDDIRHCLSLPVLGGVPRFNVAHSGVDGGTPLQAALCYYHRPASAEADAYRSVRTALFVATAQGQSKLIQVTSPEAGDGKTTLASNLSIAMAQSGKRVLLVDADLRCPMIHRIFDIPRGGGMSEILADELDLPTATRETSIQGLSLLTAGTAGANPAETLSSPLFVNLLQQAKHKFDYVVVDTPPLLTVSDPCIVATYTDGVLLVLRASKSKRLVAQHATELLRTHGINVIGVVANSLTDTIENSYGSAYSNYYWSDQTNAFDKQKGSFARSDVTTA